MQESGLKPNNGNYLVGFSAIFTPEEEREQLSFEYIDDLRSELNFDKANLN
ncbi:MAG: hypothetical protein QNJ41_04965 [Xenococcaceae cyanobacterium MO_188.B32]|nr:hypothetical protein [Xenococcaceae cyanobacterium MO_188.B32]